jgi:hypothetical protein
LPDSNAPMASSNWAPITGVFGYTLGDLMDDGTPDKIYTNADGQTLVFFTQNYPPFSLITFGILKDRRIEVIRATYSGTNWADEREVIVTAPESKYGPARHKDLLGSAVTEWGDDHRSISIGDNSVDYVDMDLIYEGVRAKKAATDARAKQIAPSL